MREIKFRAWNEETKTMHLVNTLDWDETGCLYEIDAGYNYSEKYQPEIFHKTHIMQYTGLKDKNGKEIYEGDIVTTQEDGLRIYHVVRFDGGCFVFRRVKEVVLMDTLNSDRKKELVGNIYENPELIK